VSDPDIDWQEQYHASAEEYGDLRAEHVLALARTVALEDEVVRLREQLRAEQTRADRLECQMADVARIARETAARYGLTADASWDHEPAYWIGRLGSHIGTLDLVLWETQAEAERLRCELDERGRA